MTIDLTTVDGVAVIARQTATHETPITNGVPSLITGVDQVLLEDGRTVYQCVFEGADCGKIYDAPLSARAHLVAHSVKRASARAAREAERELAEIKAKRTAASTKAAQTRRERREAAREHNPDVATELSATDPAVGTVELGDGTDLGKRLTDIVELIGEIQTDIGKKLKRLKHEVDELAFDVDNLPIATHELVDKARKFDQFQELMGK